MSQMGHEETKSNLRVESATPQQADISRSGQQASSVSGTEVASRLAFDPWTVRRPASEFPGELALDGVVLDVARELPGIGDAERRLRRDLQVQPAIYNTIPRL